MCPDRMRSHVARHGAARAATHVPARHHAVRADGAAGPVGGDRRSRRRHEPALRRDRRPRGRLARHRRQRAMLAGSSAAQLAETSLCRPATRRSRPVALAAWAAAEVGEVADTALLGPAGPHGRGRAARADRRFRLDAHRAAGGAEVPGAVRARRARRDPAAPSQGAMASSRTRCPGTASQPPGARRLLRRSGVSHPGAGTAPCRNCEPQSLAAAERAQPDRAATGDAGQWCALRRAHRRRRRGVPGLQRPPARDGADGLLDLYEAGGADHRSAITAGLSWLQNHPEAAGTLFDESSGVIWRKIGRREPRKAVRSIRSMSTALWPGLRLGLLDRVFPPSVIDHECRPYELGWLLYAWLASGIVGARS